MQKKCSIYLRLLSVRRSVAVFFGCACFLLGPNDVEAQSKTGAWTLRACIEHAREHNIQVEYARVTLKNTSVELSRDKAQRLPSLVFSSTQGWGHQKKADASTGELNSMNAYTGNYSLSGDLSLYEGRRLTNTIRQRGIEERALEQEVVVAQNNIEEAVTEAYLQILYANETLKTNRQTLESSASQLNRSKGLHAAGSISQSDLSQMESQYSSDLYRVVQSENDLALAKLQLKQLLELGPDDDFEVVFPELDDKDVLLLVPGLEDVYREALRVRPEIQSKQMGVEASSLGERIARGGYFPTVSLSASVTTNHDSKSSDSYGTQLNDRLVENVGVNISIPIANRKQVRTNVAKARLQTEQARLDDRNVRKDLLQTVESLHQDVIAAQSRYQSALQRVKSTGESYRLVENEYKAGLKNVVDLLVEKNNYLSALQEQIQAKYQAVLAYKLLNFYRNEPINL